MTAKTARAITITALRVVSIVCGATYFATTPLHPFTGSVAIKGLSIFAIAVVAWILGPRLLSIALAASSVGDVLLDMQPDRLFIPALCAFLAAHIIYTVLFARYWHRPKPVLLVLVLMYVVAFSSWIASSLGSMTIPVAIYICVITAMITSAISAALPRSVWIGAILFLVSDSLLAAAKFKGTFTWRDYLVWGTYYAAQYFIATGVLSGEEYLNRARNFKRTMEATNQR